MILANGQYMNPLKRLMKNIYTCFVPKISTLVAKKKWIVGSIGSSAKIFIDGGAAKALKNGKSLLAAGITKVVGEFKGDNILVVDNNEHELARGLSSFLQRN